MIDMNFMSIEYVVVAMAFVILYLLYYVFTKDSEFQGNIHSVASVVEELNREIFYLKKELKETKNNIQTDSTRMSDEDVYAEVERTVYDMVKPLSMGLKRMEDALVAIEEQTDIRVSSLETGVKQISIPTSVHGNDDEKIISLFKQGISLDTISKELHISKAEVEFVLKINKIK